MTEQLSNFATAFAGQAIEEAKLAVAPLNPRRDQVLAALRATTVNDDEDMRRAIDKIALGKALRDAADAALVPIGTPYKDATHGVANVGKDFVDPLKSAERAVQDQIDAFRRRQREAAARAANEQREREAALRAQAGLESQPVEKVTAADVRLGSTRSDYRGQAFDRKVLKITIEDARLLPDTILKSPGVVAALESAVRRMAGLTHDIPGAKVETDQKTTVKA